MKISKTIQCIFVAGALLAACPVLAQTPPTLSCQLYAGVSITGIPGGVYAVQASSNLASSNGWTCVAVVELPSTNLIWADTSASASSGQRFYRAVQTATNMVYIGPGTFTMGSPTNEAGRSFFEWQHVVTISRGFCMGKFLVTQAEYQAVTGGNPSQNTGNMNLPVDAVRWWQATNYCAMRTAQEQAAGLIPTNMAYRLPTESEWEYACRAGTVTAFYLGNDLRSQQANFAATNEYDSVVGTEYNPNGVVLNTSTVVGSYAPNGWGLYDMAGNLYEWCSDLSGNYPVGSVVDPQGAATGITRIQRGGSYQSGAVLCRSAARYSLDPTQRASNCGFRVVLAATP